MRKIFVMFCISATCLFGTTSFATVNDNQVTSQKIKEADGTTGQDTNTGSGVKTGHIQDRAVTSKKIGFLKNVIIVAPEGGDFADPHTAVGSITDASASNPYIVKVMPGNYLAPYLQMKSYVTLQGSGIDVTTITAEVATAQNSTVSQMTLLNMPSRHVMNVVGDTTLDHVKMISDTQYVIFLGGTNNNFIDCHLQGPDTGISVYDGLFNLKNSTIVAGNNALRLDCQTEGTDMIENSVLQSSNAALFVYDPPLRVDIKNSTITGSGIFETFPCPECGDQFSVNIANSQINANYSMLRSGYDKMVGCYDQNFIAVPNFQ